MSTTAAMTCPKCGRKTLTTTKTIRFSVPDGEPSLRVILECSHCKRAVVQAEALPDKQTSC